MFWHVSVLPSINLSVHGGGYPYPIMLCNISQNAMGQLGGGTLPGPAGGGTLVGGVPWLGGYPGWGGTQLGQHREYLLHGRWVCLLHSCRRTFLFSFRFHIDTIHSQWISPKVLILHCLTSTSCYVICNYEYTLILVLSYQDHRHCIQIHSKGTFEPIFDCTNSFTDRKNFVVISSSARSTSKLGKLK